MEVQQKLAKLLTKEFLALGNICFGRSLTKGWQRSLTQGPFTSLTEGSVNHLAIPFSPILGERISKIFDKRICGKRIFQGFFLQFHL